MENEAIRSLETIIVWRRGSNPGKLLRISKAYYPNHVKSYKRKQMIAPPHNLAATTQQTFSTSQSLLDQDLGDTDVI